MPLRSKENCKIYLFFSFILCFFVFPFQVDNVYAASFDIYSEDDWNSGTFENVTTVKKGLGIQLTSDGTWGALAWNSSDKVLSAGAAFASDGDYMYVVRGLGDSSFWRLDPSDGEWLDLADLPGGAYYGSDIQYLDGYIYAVLGGYQKTFARYSISNDSWEVLEDFNDMTYYGTSMESDGVDIFVATANNTQGFYKYDVSEGEWIALAGTPTTFRQGSDLEYVDGYLYTPRGANTSTFYRYEIATNTWTQMANAPTTFYDDMDITSYNGEIFVSKQYNTTSFYKYSIATDSWTTLADAPLSSRYGGVQYMESDGYVYFFRGNGDYRYWKYDIANDLFVGPSDAPGSLSTGSDMVYYDGSLYIPRGANQTTLYSYDLDSDIWSTLASAPTTFNDDVRGVLVGTDIYWFRGSNTLTFYKYSITTNTWTTLSDAPATIRYGGALAYPGSGDYIYATRGNNTNSFYRYTISSDTWETVLADLPVGIRMGYGSTLLSDGTDIFATTGTGTSRMFKYDIQTDVWNELSGLPFGAHYGTDTTYSDGKILAVAGNYKKEVWEYTISTDSWRHLPDYFGYRQLDTGSWTGSSIEYVGNGNYYLSRGGNNPELLVYTAGENNYNNSGVWISNIYDFEYVSSWNSISITDSVPDDSYYTVQTRTSSDSISWSDWESISEGNIVSPENQFIQIMVTLFSSSSHEFTSLVKGISVDYASDENAPYQVANVIGESMDVGGDLLVNGGSYSYTNPSFSWDDAVDDETVVLGYYVYFGSDPEGDPISEGVYTSDSKYLVSKELSVGSNYLRIISEDLLGNKSEILDAFEYVYEGVGPVLSLEVQEQSFEGTFDNVQLLSSNIKLENQEDGFWEESFLSLSPAGFYYGAKNIAYVESSNKVYAPRGTGNTFYEYDLSADVWTTLANAPDSIYYGGGAVEGPTGYIYVLRGYNSTDFWKYDIENDTWDTEISNTPLTVGYGGSAVFDGEQYIYVLRGNNSDVFWRYDTFEDSWESLAKTDFGAPADAINNDVYVGGSLGFDKEKGLIYANQGGYKHGFSVYEIDTDTWTVLPNVPALAYHGGSIEYYSGSDSVYYMEGNNNNDLFKYDVATQEWTRMNSAPYGISYGGGLHLIDDIFFVLRGGNSAFVYTYDIESNSWKIPQRGLFGKEVLGSAILNTNYGADITKGDGNNYYLARGYYSDYFVSWNEDTGVVTSLASTPVGSYYGSSLIYDNTDNRIYFTGGVYDQGFYYYDIETNLWTQLDDDPLPSVSSYGSSMDYDGSQYIYWSAGGNSNAVYSYDTQGVSGERWTRLTNPPAGLGYGSDLLIKDGYIYTARGQNVSPNPFYRYDISAGTWDTLSSYPEQIYNDGFLVDGGNGYLYAARGGNTNVFYKYNLSTDTWTSAPNFPGQIYSGGSGASNFLNSVYVLSGSGSNTYQDALYTYILESENSGFVQEGSYISQSHDLTSVYKWAGLTLDSELFNNTNLIIETSTSEDNLEWSEWSEVCREKREGGLYKYKITSPVNRYIKVRFTLYSGDGVLSPSIASYSINYYQDLVKPENPSTSGLAPLGEVDSEEILSTDTWYNYSSPIFSWAEEGDVLGATDGSNGSGVSGYYVYWGTEPEGDPETEGDLQTEVTYSPTDLVDAETYYLRIQTVDNADNISDEIWEPFVYKYDSSGPESPADLNSDPSGFTAVDSFSFSWSSVETDGAGITGYCYKTGTTEGQFSTEQCITETSIENIPSYRVGSNTFYVRSQDEAGNYSEYSTVNYFYVDADHAPAPPTNLQVQPVTNTENSFGFTWDPPLEGTFYGSQSNLSYLYSVNALPTEFSTSATSLKYLNPGAYATLPGENILYIVTKDEAGNVDYSNYAQVSFYANTIAPGIPINIEIADVSVKSTSSWRLAISWDEPEDAGSGVGGYQIYRSNDGESYYFHSYTSGASLVDSKLLQVMYYYKVRACDSTNNCGAFSEVVNFLPDGRYTEPADIIVDPLISNITPKKATVAWVTARTADSKVAYGVESGVYFEEEVSNSDHVVDHILTINNLTPGTTYYYVTKWTDEDGNTGVSEESTFETAPPPSIEEPVVKHVGLNSALIEFTTRDTSKVRIFYGETSSFGGMKEVYTGTSEGTHNVEIGDIKDGTKYFYKINTFDIDGSEYEGEIHSFETLPRPRISGVEIYQVSGTSTSTLLLEWDSNTAISSLITYYPVGHPEKAIDEVNVTLKTGKHRMILTNLEANTQYSIIVSGRDFMGNEATSGVNNFETATDTRPPQIYDLEVTSEIIGSGQESTAQLVVSYNTDEASTSQVEYGEGTGTTYSQKTQEDSSLSTHHIVIVSGLIPSKVYHLRSISKDAEGNDGVSIDKVVVTSSATENALDLAINNLTSIFSFLGK